MVFILRLVAALAFALAASSAPAQPAGRLVTAQIESKSFTGSRIGISPTRNVSIYLPPRYGEGGRRFPVLYFLNHFFQDHREPFATHGAKGLLDKAIREGVIDDLIVVTADFATPAGSSWFVNSSATGNWEDFMVRELVPFVDAHYRTLATRNSRGIAGDGVGGYGAIRFGMRRPDMFGAVYAMQPLGTGGSIQPTHSRPDFELLARARSLDEVEGFSRIFTSIYQAFVPNPDRPPLYFDPPARRVRGELVVDSRTMARFHEHIELAGLVSAYADNLKSLRGFKFDWGRMDPITDHIHGSRNLAYRLSEFGVPMEAEEYDGGFRDRHWGERGRFYTEVLPFFARHLLFGPAKSAHDRVVAAHETLRSAIEANDAEARAGLYRRDARSMPEYQPALFGADQIAAYHHVLNARRNVKRYVPVTTEVFDLGGTFLEIGTFTIGWQTATGSLEEERGKFVNVWAEEPDRSLRLKADVWGYFRPLADPSQFFVDIPERLPPERRLSAGEQRLAALLATRNVRNAEAVRTNDAEAKIADYSDDAVIMPFADTTKSGIEEIRPYLIAYTDAGRGVSFDAVHVWNIGFEDFGDYVIEYPKFRVDSSTAEWSAVVKGGGLRLWQRQRDGSLKLHRQIGTHDHVG
jgi:ketosteroid isomerase-like protein